MNESGEEVWKASLGKKPLIRMTRRHLYSWSEKANGERFQAGISFRFRPQKWKQVSSVIGTDLSAQLLLSLS